MALFAHPILLATGSALVILLLFFFVEYLIECGDVKKGNFITLAPFEWSYESVDGPAQTRNTVDFSPRIGHYLKVAEVIVTLSSASLVFIPSLHVGNANPMFAYAIVMLGFSVFYGVLFMALMTYFYEMFLYNPRNFGALQSSTMFSFGFSGLMCFGLAYLVIAIQVALAYTTGALGKCV